MESRQGASTVSSAIPVIEQLYSVTILLKPTHGTRTPELLPSKPLVLEWPCSILGMAIPDVVIVAVRLFTVCFNVLVLNSVIDGRTDRQTVV